MIQPASEKTEMMMVSHSLHPEPIETHVFFSLTYRIPLGVVAESGAWIVTGAQMKKIERDSPAD
jgi:hypothetical protein